MTDYDEIRYDIPPPKPRNKGISAKLRALRPGSSRVFENISRSQRANIYTQARQLCIKITSQYENGNNLRVWRLPDDEPLTTRDPWRDGWPDEAKPK